MAKSGHSDNQHGKTEVGAVPENIEAKFILVSLRNMERYVNISKKVDNIYRKRRDVNTGNTKRGKELYRNNLAIVLRIFL